jgi:hypothetical protein
MDAMDHTRTFDIGEGIRVLTGAADTNLWLLPWWMGTTERRLRFGLMLATLEASLTAAPARAIIFTGYDDHIAEGWHVWALVGRVRPGVYLYRNPLETGPSRIITAEDLYSDYWRVFYGQ